MCRPDDYPPYDVPMAEQVLSAERMVQILDAPNPPSAFAIEVLEEYGLTDPLRDVWGLHWPQAGAPMCSLPDGEGIG